MEEIAFYWEWLSLPKDQFRLLAMTAASGGRFDGNYTDMCNYLSVTPQSRNREKIKSALEVLASAGYIEWEQSGRTHHLKIIPKETEIKIPLALTKSIINHEYSSEEQVAWEQVLRLYMWICHNTQDIIQNFMIETDLNISESVVTKAKKVLAVEYETIYRKDASAKYGLDSFVKLGQRLQALAWWKDINK